MLLILSEKGDLSTNDVIDWLDYFHVPFIRLNTDEASGVTLFAERTGEGLKCFVKTSTHTVSFDQITAYWYRRGGIPQFRIPAQSVNAAFEEKIAAKVKDYLNMESRTLYAFLHKQLDAIPGKIGSYEKGGVNKLMVLEMAHKLGIRIPDWCISMQLNDSMEFLRKSEQVITKGIWESLMVSTDYSGYNTFTELVEAEELSQLPERHFPSLLQKNIPKQYEVRSFYLLGKFWSMAIFSQKDPQTSIDFRKYNDDKPNRNIPFKLPEELEKKLHQLMLELELETGSMDLIVDENDEFIFLEVNPVGQFGMTSSPCNYNLEKQIASHFAKTMSYEKV